MTTRAWSCRLRPSWRGPRLFLVVAAALAAIFAAGAQGQDQRTVTRVIDGDTVVLDGGERVRLIGVDTPETVHPNKPVERFGKEASEFTRRMAEGKQVRLEYDAETATHDRYGRTLAYVYLPDESLLNLEIIRQGYGHAYTRFPFSRMEEFREAEREAREAQRGLWAGDGGEAQTESPRSERTPRDDGTDPDQGSPSIGFVHGREVATLAQRPPSESASQLPRNCIPQSQCCRVCGKGKACGNSCISRRYACRKGRGCACNASDVCR